MWTRPGSRSCLFPHTGLRRLHFLFRASGTQQFIPTGKYKADGVLETVRLSGKLSRNPWLGLGTVSFRISKSFLSWGGPAPPVAPPEPPPGAGAGAGGGQVGAWGWALARTGFMAPTKADGQPVTLRPYQAQSSPRRRPPPWGLRFPEWLRVTWVWAPVALGA